MSNKYFRRLFLLNTNLDKFRKSVKTNKDVQNKRYITLKDDTGMPLAILELENIYKPDLRNECRKIYGTLDTNHPYVKYLQENPNVMNIVGELRKIALPYYYDNEKLRMTPTDVMKLYYLIITLYF